MRGAWVYLVSIATLCIAGAYIAHLRLSDIPDPAVGHSSHPPTLGIPQERVIEYRLDGPAGAKVSASYLDANGTVQEVAGTFPWQTTVYTRQLTLPTGLVAQSSTGQMSCRITINGEVRDAKDSNSSAVSCKVVVA